MIIPYICVFYQLELTQFNAKLFLSIDFNLLQVQIVFMSYLYKENVA